MKSLYLMRHAKSDWGDYTLPDHERPLNERGCEAAAKMGAYFDTNGISPALILCSTAKRTRETLDILISNSGITAPTEYCADIYEASVQTLMSLIKDKGANNSSLLMIGHNPGFHMLGLELSKPSEGNAYQKLLHRLPTGALMEIEFDGETFSEIASQTGHLRSFIRPKSL